MTDALEVSFLDFARPIVTDIRKAAPEDVPHQGVPRVVVENGQLVGKVEPRANISAFLSERYPDPTALAGAAACVRLHLQAGVYLQPATTGSNEQMSAVPNEMLVPTFCAVLLEVLADAIVDADSLHVKETQLVAAYRRYRKQWEAKTYKVTYLVPLFKFDSSCSLPWKVSGSLTLQAFSDSLKAAFIQAHMRGVSATGDEEIGLGAILKTQCLLTITEKRNRGALPFSQSMIDEVGDFVTALRLHSPGVVGISFAYAVFDTITLHEIITVLDDHRSARPAPGYQLQEEDRKYVLRLFRTLRALRSKKGDPSLRTAIHHFNQSYKRIAAEDRLIDATISLEASLLAGERDELRFRLALRGAALLTTGRLTRTPESKLNHKKFLAGLYDARSKIVHEGLSLQDLVTKEKNIGTKLTALAFTISDVPDAAEAIVRSVLRTYLDVTERAHSLREVNEKLEDHIFQKLTRVKY